MADNSGFASTWNFSNTHVDTNINPATDLVSAARCLIYARPSSYGVDEANSNSKFMRCGLIQGFSYGEQRDIQRIFEIGSDVPYLVPGRNYINLNLSRILLFGADLVNALYYSAQNEGVTSDELYKSNIEAISGNANSENIIRSIGDIKKPVDLLFTYYKNTGEAGTNDQGSSRYTRIFRECHITSRSESVDAGNIIVAEQVAIVAAKMGAVKIQ